MATTGRARTFHASPQVIQVLTDLFSTPPRETRAFDPFTAVFLGATELENLPVGGGTPIVGTSRRGQARERAFSDQLLATLQRNAPAREKAAEILRNTTSENIPSERELRQQKAAVIQAAAPLALEEKILDLDVEQAKIDASRALQPIIIELKSAEVQSTQSLAAKRAAEAANLINLSAVEADRVAAETEFLQARAAAEALQPTTFDLATGGLDFFSKQVLARELIRVAAGERPFFAPVERRRRVITSF